MEFRWSAGLEVRQRMKQGQKIGSPGTGRSGHAPGAGNSQTLLPPVGEGRLAAAASAPDLRSLASARVAAVVARQSEPTAILAKRIAMSKASVAYSQQEKHHSDANVLVGVPGFRTHLQGKYGSTLAGWRAMDKDGSGRLSFHELCGACRAMGFGGNLKRLWEELDTNCNGHVTIMDLDAQVGQTAGKYRQALVAKHGDILAAWFEGIDTQGRGRVQEPEVTASLERLGLQDEINGKRLFKMLALFGSRTLSLSDFDSGAYKRWQSGEYSAPAKAQAARELQEGQLPQASAEGAEAGRSRGAKVADEAPLFRAGLHTAGQLRKALVARCGSLLRAWREALDVDGLGRLTFGDFCVALDRLGLSGEVKALWMQLVNKSNAVANSRAPQPQGLLYFVDLDPATSQALDEAKSKLSEKYGNILLAWVKGLDQRGCGLVTMGDFVAVLKDAGCTVDGQALFRQMMPGSGSSLTLRDFDTRAFKSVSRNDWRMLTEREASHGVADRGLEDAGEGEAKHHELTFHERQVAGFKYQLQEAFAAAHGEDFARKFSNSGVPEETRPGIEDFDALCIRTFGSMVAAWRYCLDVDAYGRLAFCEFCKSLRRLGYGGDFKSLFYNYGGLQRGFVTLADLDPEAENLVTSFFSLLAVQYEALDDAWKLCFHKDKFDSMDERELTEACDRLGYGYSPKKLFRCLQPTPGKLMLTIWDLDPECTKKMQRGERPVFRQPKSPVRPPASGKSCPRAAGEEYYAAKMRAAEENGTLPSQKKNEEYMKAGSSLLPVLRQNLRVHYGSTLAAWRTAMDPKLTGSISFGSFVLGLEETGFSGNVKALWKVLAGDRGVATFADVDPETLKQVEEARRVFLERYGTLSEVWLACFGFGDKGQLPLDAFVAAIQQQGLAVAQPEKLFKVLLARISQKSLVKEDLRALLVGVPLEYQSLLWAGAASPPPPRPVSAARAQEVAEGEVAAPPPQADRAARPRSATPSSPVSPKAHVQTVKDELQGMDKGISSVDGFKRKLIEKFGSLFSAWMNLLDADHNNLMVQVDFAAACRLLGIKAITRLWGEMDPAGKGSVTLRDFDPESAMIVEELTELMLHFNDHLKVAWRKVFDPEKARRTDLGQFRRGCKQLGFSCVPPERAFELLRPEAGRPYLMFEDVFHDVDKNDNTLPQEVTAAAAASPKSALASPSRARAAAREAAEAKAEVAVAVRAVRAMAYARAASQ